MLEMPWKTVSLRLCPILLFNGFLIVLFLFAPYIGPKMVPIKTFSLFIGLKTIDFICILIVSQQWQSFVILMETMSHYTRTCCTSLCEKITTICLVGRRRSSIWLKEIQKRPWADDKFGKKIRRPCFPVKLVKILL